MPSPGNSFLPEIAYWPGDPTSVAASAFSPPQGTIVLDTNGGTPRVKTSTDNSGFSQVALQGQATNSAILSSSPTGGVGYSTGAGGAVTQATNRTTGVTLNKISGAITTNNASLAAETAAAFTVTNSAVALGDVPVLAIQSGSNGGNTTVTVTTVAAGSFQITVANQNAAAGTAETGAIIVNFCIIRAVAA